jgi:glucokinase
VGAGVLLGLDFGGTKVAVALANTDGEVITRGEIPTDADRGAVQVIERGINLATRMVAEGKQPLCGIGVASMGITLEDRVLLAPNVPGWEQVAIPHRLREAFGDVPLRIENDVKTATYAELRWGALRGVENGLYVNLGTGIAAGLVVGGRVVRGTHGAAGEIGFNPRWPGEREGAAGGRAPLEEHLGGRALAKRMRERYNLEIGEAFARYHDVTEVREEIDEIFDGLAFHLANLAIALDPSRIVLGAGLMRSTDVVLSGLRERLDRFTPFPVEIVAARFLIDAALFGAVALAAAPMPSV